MKQEESLVEKLLKARQETRVATLREVGEWLEKHIILTPALEVLIVGLKAGSLPEGGK